MSLYDILLSNLDKLVAGKLLKVGSYGLTSLVCEVYCGQCQLHQ